jgi:hypothetical protein
MKLGQTLSMMLAKTPVRDGRHERLPEDRYKAMSQRVSDRWQGPGFPVCLPILLYQA